MEDPNKVTGDGTLSLPIYAIKPGKSLGGFEISSAQPPGTVQFFAEGFTQPPTGTPTADNDEPIPDCPGWDFESSKLQTQVTGMTVGPSDPSVISVRIRAREEKGLRSCDPIKPKSPSGKISVLVFSTQFFDASKIDIKNVFFGPGYAIPTASKLVPVGQGEQGDSDERAEWERSNDNLKLEDLDRKKVKFQNMLLTFDVATLDVQCNLDQALFLRGKTISGQQFIGGVKAEIAGCDSKDLGKHKNHQPPFKWWVK